MRVAFIGDTHIRASLRWDEGKRILQWLVDDLAERKPDLIVHTGDVYDRATLPEERYDGARWFQLLAGIAPVVVVRGNHDPLGDLPLLERLETEHPIRVTQSCSVELIETRSGKVALGLLAWPHRANIAELAAATTQEEVETAAADAIRNVLRYFGTWFDELDPGIPRIVAAHAMVRGSVTSTGQPLVGCDFEIGVEDLSLARADFVALGHVHKGQEWQGGRGEPIVYTASPRRIDFGELEPKGYVIAEFGGLSATARREVQAGEFVSTADVALRPGVTWERIETPCTPMVLVEDEWVDVGGRWDWSDLKGYEDPSSVAGAEVKFRYQVPAAQREAAALAAEATRTVLLQDGAVSVVLEPKVQVDTRARAPEVARARTLEDKLDALWKAKGFEPGARREPLLAKLAELQGAQ